MAEVKTIAVNLKDIVQQIVQEGIAGGKAEPGRLPLADQVKKLRELRAAYDAPPQDLQPGDFVRLKDGAGIIKDELRESIVMMFWRMLDPSNVADRASIKRWVRKVPGDEPDCIVAYLCDDGHCLNKVPMSRRDLERWALSDAPPAASAERFGNVPDYRV